MLREYTSLPEGFLQAEPQGLEPLLGGPSLIYLPGERERPLFVSIMLHGNEVTGLRAVQALLQRYRGKALPRALILFVGNVAAAAHGLRRMPEQPDYNRIWPMSGGQIAAPPCAETEMAKAVYQRVAARRPFAVVDVHNNSGRNPHYAAINQLSAGCVQLARSFARQMLFFEYPPGTLGMSLGQLAPAVTLECGLIGRASGEQHASQFLDDCLQRVSIEQSMPAQEEVELFRTQACITVPDGVSIGVGDATAQLRLPSGLDGLNWQLQPAGTVFAQVEGLAGTVLQVNDPDGCDCADRFLRRVGARIELAQTVTPAMISMDTRIIRQDCLCYLMQRLPLPALAE